MLSDYFQYLTNQTSDHLDKLLYSGACPAPELLDGWEWAGQNSGTIPGILGIRKFIKGFFVDDAGLEGYNVVAIQNDLGEPWLEKPSAMEKRRFGYYQVYPARQAKNYNAFPGALLLDYGASRRNPAFSVTRVLRDYLIQPDPDNPDVLLGKAYLALGPLGLPSNYFFLERLQQAPGRALNQEL